ncbi:hypothetical protein [Inquilinus sp. Marseille-Q2685]|uniref:hypothetical protein n=1 Tax=Inquilinus sp. Marseille-Q2685 TaxID=2866581 RepID=UPI001CE44301|nr:hypothetical protein [Inquilinus sp. Marseille-Q2685]
MPKPSRGEDAATRSRPFEPYRLPIAAASRSLIETSIGLIEGAEATNRPRKRDRRPADRKAFVSLVTAIVSDLAYRALETGEDNAGIWMTLRRDALCRRSDRYTPPWLGSTLPNLLAVMARPDVALCRMVKGSWGGSSGTPGTMTEVYPGAALLDRLAGLRLSDFDLCPTQELVLLRDGRDEDGNRGSLLDYQDDATTERLRSEVQSINAWLAEADISIDPAAPGADRIDTSYRRLRRRFTNSSFTSGGRLFGGHWQGMSKVERRALRINGEPVVGLDYNAASLRMLYGKVGATLPAGDPYSIGALAQWPRPAIKKLIAAMTFDKTIVEKSSAKTGLPQWPDEVREMFVDPPPLWRVRAAIEQAHKPIVPLLYRGIGHQLQFTESNLMVELLLILRDRGWIGLPVHDCLIVPQSLVPRIRGLMLHLFILHTGAEGAVEVE